MSTKPMTITTPDSYQHSRDTDSEGNRACFFSNATWGFWVAASGEIRVDDVSSNGSLPDGAIVDECREWAKAYLASE